MAQIWNRHTDNLFSRFLCLEHAQDAHEHTEQPTTQLGSVSFVDAVTGEVEASICQQIKLSAAYLKGGWILAFQILNLATRPSFLEVLSYYYKKM